MWNLESGIDLNSEFGMRNSELWYRLRRCYFDISLYTNNQLKTVQKIKHNLSFMDYAKIFCLQFYWLFVLGDGFPVLFATNSVKSG